MGNFRYAIGKPFVLLGRGDFHVATGTVSSSDKAGFDKANVATEPIAREWRSNSVGSDQYVGLDFGSTKSFAAILVEGANVDTFAVRGGGNANLASDTLYRQVTSLVANPRNRRFSTLTVVNASARYVGVVIAASTARQDGSAEFAVGRITVIETLRTMVRNWSTGYRYTSNRISEDVVFPSGAVQSMQPSGLWCEFALDGEFDIRNTSEVADADRFFSARSDERVLHFENRTADSQSVHAYLCKVNDPNMVEQFPSLKLDLELREVI